MKSIQSEAPHGGHGASGSGGPCDERVLFVSPNTNIGQNVSGVDPRIYVIVRSASSRCWRLCQAPGLASS